MNSYKKNFNDKLSFNVGINNKQKFIFILIILHFEKYA